MSRRVAGALQVIKTSSRFVTLFIFIHKGEKNEYKHGRCEDNPFSIMGSCNVCLATGGCAAII
jgi:hypothetical protein